MKFVKVLFLIMTAGFLLSENGIAEVSLYSYTMTNSQLAGNTVRAIVADKDVPGVLWIGTNNGLNRLDTNGTEVWTTFTTADNLVDNKVTSLVYEKSQSKLWVGTEGGVSVMNTNPDSLYFTAHYLKNSSGLASNLIHATAIDSLYGKWFGTDSGASRFYGGSWVTYSTANFLMTNLVQSIVIEPSQKWIHIGTGGAGIYRLEPVMDALTAASSIDSDWSSLESDNVYSMYLEWTSGLDGEKWFGTDYGISKHTGPDVKNDLNWTSYTTFSTDGMLAGNIVYAINAEKEDGIIWFGTDGGVSRFNKNSDTWKKFTVADGLAGENVYSIEIEGNSAWFATDGGLTKLDLTTVSVEESPALPEALSINRNYPNPFNPETTIEFAIPHSGYTYIAVYNSEGQRVRDLIDGYFPAGTHSVKWNSLDNRGRQVSSGVYIVRLTQGGTSVTSRVLLMK